MLSRLPFCPWRKRLGRILLLLLLVLVFVAISGITFVEVRRRQTLVLPTPTGPYAVGRIEYDWTDQRRTDSLAPQANMKRELVVWAWYPAVHVSGAEVAPYLPSKWAQLSDQQHGFLGQHLFQSSDSIQTHSFDNAPLATALARYPVLIFEPGLGNIPTQYTTLLEDLASHGYIIFAITPTYSADVVVFPDGRVADHTHLCTCLLRYISEQDAFPAVAGSDERLPGGAILSPLTHPSGSRWRILHLFPSGLFLFLFRPV